MVDVHEGLVLNKKKSSAPFDVIYVVVTVLCQACSCVAIAANAVKQLGDA